MWNLVLELVSQSMGTPSTAEGVHQWKRPYRHPRIELIVGYDQGSLACWAEVRRDFYSEGHGLELGSVSIRPVGFGDISASKVYHRWVPPNYYALNGSKGSVGDSLG